MKNLNKKINSGNVGIDNPVTGVFGNGSWKDSDVFPKIDSNVIRERRLDLLKSFKEKNKSMGVERFCNKDFHRFLIEFVGSYSYYRNGEGDSMRYHNIENNENDYGYKHLRLKSLDTVFSFLASSDFCTEYKLVSCGFLESLSADDLRFYTEFRNEFYTSLEGMVGRSQLVYDMLMRAGSTFSQESSYVIENYFSRVGDEGLKQMFSVKGNVEELKTSLGAESLVGFGELKFPLSRFISNYFELYHKANDESLRSFITDWFYGGENKKFLEAQEIPYPILPSLFSLYHHTLSNLPIKSDESNYYFISDMIGKILLMSGSEQLVGSLSSLRKYKVYKSLFGRAGLDSMKRLVAFRQENEKESDD